MTAHARLSASGSHRWINCPGSVKAEEGFPDTTSLAASEGTAAHELAELVLVNGGTCFDWIGKPLPDNNAFTVDQTMAEYVQEYVDYVVALGGDQEYEIRVDFSEWVPGGFGTSDAIVIKGSTLYVVDLKYGKGVLVEAEENTQGLLYALGALEEYGYLYDIEKVVIVIVQPRRDHISEWNLSKSDLLKRGEWISQRAELANEPDAERVPGESQCQWCKAKATCPALMALTHQTIAADFDNLDCMVNPDRLGDEDLRRALDNKALIVSWFDAVEKHVFSRIEAGEEFKGYKLVEGRSLRQWRDEDEAAAVLETMLENDAYERKLLSPSKAEKAVGKTKAGELESLIVKPKGKPTLVPESDKRPPIGATADDFDFGP